MQTAKEVLVIELKDDRLLFSCKQVHPSACLSIDSQRIWWKSVGPHADVDQSF
jgi:hypothetical protein